MYITPRPEAAVDCDIHRILRGPLRSVLNELRLKSLSEILSLSGKQNVLVKDISVEDIPSVIFQTAEIRVLAGQYHGLMGPVVSLDAQPFIVDVTLKAEAEVTLPICEGHGGIIHVLNEAIAAGNTLIHQGHSALISGGNTVTLLAGGKGARALIITTPA